MLGHSFRDASLLDEALTHSSWANENSPARHNERLEFLGDAVLGLCVAELLYERHGEWDEGQLTHERAREVCEGALAEWARESGIADALKLGRGMPRPAASMCADAVEAVLGAIFLDGGIDAARAAVRARLAAPHYVGDAPECRDPKSLLQERLQGVGMRPPRYILRDKDGPDHAPEFAVDLCLDDGETIASGRGPSKKAAEFEAASEALRVIDREIARRGRGS